MEKSVTDESITNVLILLDPIYAQKANAHIGGVGTETQIISPEIYGKVSQDKFLPVVFERDENSNVCKPAFLKGALHFDLSQDENYNDEYQRLVKRLYGVEVYEKPKIGKKPTWVDEVAIVDVKIINKYDNLKSNVPERVKADLFRNYLSDIEKNIYDYENSEPQGSILLEKYIELYDGTKIIKNSFLSLLKYSAYIENSEKYVADFMENSMSSIYTPECKI